MAGKYEGQKVQVKAKSKTRKKKNKLRRIFKDKRYRAAFSVLMIIAAGFMGKIWQARNDKIYYTALLEQQEAQLIEEYNAKLATQRENYELAMDNLRDEYNTKTPEQIIQAEAEAIAKVLYGNALNNSERDQTTLVWCVLNRVDHTGYPDTVEEVCKEPSQWMGYSDNNPIIQSLYDIAYKELTTWHNGYRPVTNQYVFMSWSSKEIKLRDTFESTKNTRYWQAG